MFSSYYQPKMQRLTTYQARCAYLQTLTSPKDINQMLAQFRHVLSFNEPGQAIEVEGQMSYGKLVRHLWSHQLLPAIIPATKSTTVAEAMKRVSVNAGAFMSGPVIDSVIECDVWLPSGEIVTCSPHGAHQDLFFSLPNSKQQTSRILRTVIQSRKMKPYVALTHQHFGCAQSFFEKLIDMTLCSDVDFVEATVFGQHDYVITRGQFVNHAPYVNRYQLLKHYHSSLKNRQHDFMSTRHFLWRWNSDRFWRFQRAQKKWLKPQHNPLLSKLYQTPVGRQALAVWQRKSEFILKDVFMSADAAPRFLDDLLKLMPVRPLWLCPVMSNQAMHYSGFSQFQPGLLVYFGFGGIVPKRGVDQGYNQLVDQAVAEFGGAIIASSL